MICSQCGKVNAENSKFCVGCGAALTQGAAPQPNPQQQAGAAYNQQVNGPYGVNYVKGCASQAWQDIRHSGKWASRAFILGLLQFVPILHWTNTGYFYSLGKHSSRGDNSPLPGSVVSGENFKHGFFLWLIGVIITIILGLICIPFAVLASVSMPAGWVIMLPYYAFLFFSIFFIRLITMRYIMLGFDETFKLGKVWKAYKRRFGKLFCLDFLPSLLVGLIQTAFVLAFSTLIGYIVVTTGVGAVKNGAFITNADVNNYVQLVVVCVLMALVCLYFVFVLESVKQMIITRAYGIYIARYVPEWVDEAQRKEAFKSTEGFVNATPAVNPAQPADTGILTENQYAAKPQAGATPEVVPPTPKAGSDKGTSLLGSATVSLSGKNGDFDINTFPSVLGKGSSADVIITGDESISRTHAKIHEYGEEGFVIEDLKSSNKTYLNGNVLKPEELVVISDGDTLKMGKSKFTVHIS